MIANPARDSFQSLESINITGINFTASPTTEINFAANLPAQATEAGGTGEAFSMPVEYFDPVGNSERMTLQFTPTVAGAGTSNEWTLQVLDWPAAVLRSASSRSPSTAPVRPPARLPA